MKERMYTTQISLQRPFVPLHDLDPPVCDNQIDYGHRQTPRYAERPDRHNNGRVCRIIITNVPVRYEGERLVVRIHLEYQYYLSWKGLQHVRTR